MRLFLASSFASVADRFARDFPELAAGTRIAHIANAADPYVERPWVESDRAALVRLGYAVADVDLRVTRGEDLDRVLSESGAVFFAGGNVAYLAAVLRVSDAFSIVRRHTERGLVYVGSSAGSILAGPATEPFFEEDDLDCRAVGTTLAAELAKIGATEDDAKRGGFGFVPYVILPHENGPAEREDHARLRAARRGRYEFRALSDGEAVTL